MTLNFVLVGFMVYDKRKVFEEVHSSLTSNPLASLSAISQEIGVERHTIEKILREVKRMTFLEKILREVKRMTFRKYRQDRILARAIDLLGSKTSWTIQQIASILGHKSARGFSRFMKNATVRSPKQHVSHQEFKRSSYLHDPMMRGIRESLAPFTLSWCLPTIAWMFISFRNSQR